MKTCTFKDCNRQHLAKGLCKAHYNMQYYGHELHPIQKPGEKQVRRRRARVEGCSIPQCTAKHRAKGYCSNHYTQIRRYGKIGEKREKINKNTPCSIYGCDNYVHAKQLCTKHYERVRQHDDPHVCYPPKMYKVRKYEIQDLSIDYSMTSDEKEFINEVFDGNKKSIDYF